MNCSDVRPLLDLLCDGMLDAKDSAIVIDHQTLCSACRSEWNDLEQLHAYFQDVKNKHHLSAGFLDRVSAMLREEDRQEQRLFFRRCTTVFPVVAIAATTILVGFFVLPGVEKLNHRSLSVYTATADALVEDLIAEGNLDQVRDSSELTKRVGYDLKYVHLPDWQMERSGVYKSQTAVTIARFDFIRTVQSDTQRLSCYQAPAGVIRTNVPDAENLAGKNVVFGDHGKFQFAMWSKNGRDYLFVTKLSKSQLQKIVRDA
jgi:hypothetical protein